MKTLLSLYAPFSKAYQGLRADALAALPPQARYANAPFVTHSVSAFLTRFGKEHVPSSEEPVTVAGRISAIRFSGKKLVFLDVMSQGQRLQFIVNGAISKSAEQAKDLRRGDIICGTGSPARSKAGQLSLLCTEHKVLTPCLQMLPEPNSLSCLQIKQRQRYLDLLTNKTTTETFISRFKIAAQLRQAFTSAGFLEVQTPILHTQAGGANARPFSTRLQEMSLPLFLRVSPELHLKQLMVGGLERVFQLGKSFRNEGIDQTHNPQFTMIEAYAAYWDYRRMIEFTKGLLTNLSNQSGLPAPDFQQVQYLPRLQQQAGCRFDFLGHQRSVDKLIEVFQKKGLPVPAIRTEPHLVDKLCSHLVEPGLSQATFLIHQPRVISPLARPRDQLTSQRFQLFLKGRQVANGYSQLTDPAIQEQNFKRQAVLKGLDAEAMSVSQQFLGALRHGLPPCAGLGIGVDRLSMWLLGRGSIQDVVLFPVRRPG